MSETPKPAPPTEAPKAPEPPKAPETSQATKTEAAPNKPVDATAETAVSTAAAALKEKEGQQSATTTLEQHADGNNQQQTENKPDQANQSLLEMFGLKNLPGPVQEVGMLVALTGGNLQTALLLEVAIMAMRWRENNKNKKTQMAQQAAQGLADIKADAQKTEAPKQSAEPAKTPTVEAPKQPIVNATPLPQAA